MFTLTKDLPRQVNSFTAVKIPSVNTAFEVRHSCVDGMGCGMQYRARTHYANFCLFCEKICHQFPETSAPGDF